ncbi:DNA mismatch repair endonuclease MutL [Luteolibacter ambystomatis]|uniref:DNA mismatch repair protein MutL n=1 Tax=Luteolibacter ambystomatis TaxID=2824561 RepID=A0A975J188_9BACT|nr:DNA mismatch repair endonuclease MutL [Luteolibacter ambystomatis]QUE52160.1 DNA mismatch repair endonuclease MutL [Luteolibacter ambystomatis]
MPKIRVLPDILASQVAAGEVVERPASVVKELVENSIDAGAGEIRVEIERGGSARIRVIDDGCGMSKEDALLSLERHATSKLRTSADLAAISTLGFRGEAVPSIASVSRFRLVTRERDSVAGTEVLVDGGRLREVKEAGCAPGTSIEAGSLFFNMPARRKFMRAESTESAHVEHQLRLHALAAPNVRFRFEKDGREVFDLPPVARALDRVRHLLGPESASELIELPVTRGNGVSIDGFVLPAIHARKGRRHQCVFLNGRPVEDSVISRALAEGFRGAVAEGMHPAAWLWIDLEPHLVDVNVHPAKREVRFHRPLDIRDAILEAVTTALRPKPSAAIFDAPAVAVSGAPTSRPTYTPPPRQTVSPRVWTPPAAVQVPLPEAALIPPRVPEETTPPVPVSKAPPFRQLGLLHQRFVLMESEDGLVLFDPRAGRERIFYEKLLSGREEGVESQGLLVPELIELEPRDHELLVREREALAAAGVELESFGGNTVQVRGLPACLGITDSRAFVDLLIDELLHESTPGSRFAFERVARLLARRQAAGVPVRMIETTALLDSLFDCELPYCAPDGRPTLTEFSIRELERRFGLEKGP